MKHALSLENDNQFLFTSESVSEGHPDKICDQISDAILDAYLKEDPYSRVACEVLSTTNLVVVAGEVRGPESVLKNVEQIARDTVKRIGYEQEGFHWETMQVQNHLHAQSEHIAVGVDASGDKDEGAGDQGIMFGHATDETEHLMPAPIFYSHKILRLLSEARHSGEAPMLGPDAKSQVTLRYENEKPIGVDSVVVSTQHSEGFDQGELREIVRGYVKKVLPADWSIPEEKFYVNPTGVFVIGGPDGDAGLTGRKIIVDTYGGAAPHGGGAFSGKDPTKVDRSAAYMSRYLAKNVVAAGLARRCTIQLAYAIGVSQPLALYVNMHDTSRIPEKAVVEALWSEVDLSPRGIREHLQLNKPVYQRTASYGHFGRRPEADGGFSWEKTDLVDMLQRKLG